MKIQYENLTIRQAEVADAKQLAAWWNDGAVMAHAGFPKGLGTTGEEVIEGLGNGCMVILENDRLIGECNYRDIVDGIAEIWWNEGTVKYVVLLNSDMDDSYICYHLKIV